MKGTTPCLLRLSEPFRPEAVVVANGELRDSADLRRMIDETPLLLICDGALHNYMQLFQRKPDLIIGDGDSVEAEELKRMGLTFVQVQEQEYNDLTKAVRYALKQGAKRIAILGAERGRLDHTIGNSVLLAEYYKMGAEVRMISTEGMLLPFQGALQICMEAGQPISFFALTPAPMSARGVEYPFEKRSFTALWEATLNRSCRELVEVESEGLALVYLPTRQPERHTIDQSESGVQVQQLEEPTEPRFKKLYLVWAGHNPGIYQTWQECQEQLKGFSGALYRKVENVSRAEAEALFAEHPFAHLYSDTILPHAVAVDASALGNPGPMEYQGVWVADRSLIFRSKVYPEGTNNIGEYLALVHILSLMKQRGENYPIYSDSLLAIQWVHQRACKTTLAPNPTNRELFEVIERATEWLRQNDISGYQIYKWNSEAWGEIPADFGRK